MKRILLFKFLIALTALFHSSNGQPCPCYVDDSILQCNITSSSSTVNKNPCNLSGYNSINIVYSGNVVLSLTTSSSVQTIAVKPLDGSDSHVLQISNINTNAALINIQINLSSNQASTILIPATSSIIAPGSTLIINVIQSIVDPSNFQVFDTSSSPQMNFASYELIFNTTSAFSGNLNLPYLIYGLKNLTNITISGNNHNLLVDKTKMPSSIYVTQLSLKNLVLYDQILINFNNLQMYYIQGCQYNATSLFLNSTQTYTLSLKMVNNTPVNSVLPFGQNTFAQLGTLTTLIVDEPSLNSSFLKQIKILAYPSRLWLNLGQYYQSDMKAWAAYKPNIWYLTIHNIGDLSIFPPIFFNNFDAITRVILKGTFNLKKSDICIFVGINIQSFDNYAPVILDCPTCSLNDWDDCATTYILAIDTSSTSGVICPPDNTYADCQRWANAAAQCDLVTYENSCGDVQTYANNFFYNNSYLYKFFTQSLWLNGTGNQTGPSISKESSINIGAIIGAVCGLLVAIIILTVTIFFIYQRRQKNSTKYLSSTPAEKYKPSANDQTHISIATSKSSKSSRYALEQSFFPVMQPNDEIAPPLYTAPSESVGSVSAYTLSPSAPPAPRDSVSTHATHLYETLDP